MGVWHFQLVLLSQDCFGCSRLHTNFRTVHSCSVKNAVYYLNRNCIESVDRVCHIWSLLCWDMSLLYPFCWQLFGFVFLTIVVEFCQKLSLHLLITIWLLSSILLMWYPQHTGTCSSTLLSYNSNSIGDNSPLFKNPTSFLKTLKVYHLYDWPKESACTYRITSNINSSIRYEFSSLIY